MSGEDERIEELVRRVSEVLNKTNVYNRLRAMLSLYYDVNYFKNDLWADMDDCIADFLLRRVIDADNALNGKTVVIDGKEYVLHLKE